MVLRLGLNERPGGGELSESTPVELSFKFGV
jgi:hypothetical protein